MREGAIKPASEDESSSAVENFGRAAKIRGLIMYGAGPVLGLASGPVLARCLGPDGRGQFAAIMAPITVAGAVASLGLPSALVYFASKSGDSRRTYKTCLAMCALPALVVYIAMLVYAARVSSSQHIHYWILAACWLAILLSAFVQVRRALWQSIGSWRILDLERGLGAVSRFVAVVVTAIIFSDSGPAVAVAAVGAFVLSSSILFLFSPPHEKSDPTAATSHVGAASIAKFGVLSALGTITMTAGARLDQVLMPVTTSSGQLGLYAVAVTVAEVPLVLSTLCMRNALQLASVGNTLVEIVRGLQVYIAGLFATALAIAVASPLLVPLVFGREFSASIVSIEILIASTVFTGLSLILATVITGRGKPALGSAIPSFGVAVTIVMFVAFWDDVTAVCAASISLASSLGSMMLALVLSFMTRRSGVRGQDL